MILKLETPLYPAILVMIIIIYLIWSSKNGS